MTNDEGIYSMMCIDGAPAGNDWLGAELATAQQRYADRNPTSHALHERALAVMPGGNTRSALHFDPFPLYFGRSHGATLVDIDQHEYVDGLGEFTAGLYGHNHPVISTAVRSVLEGGFSNGGPGQAEIRLAELLCERFPSVETIRFCNSGTEANLYALTLAKAATGRKAVLVFSGAYHGGVFVFADPGNPMNVPFEFIVAPYNDEAAVSRIFEERGSELAAVIIEPVMSNGGCLPADHSFLRLLREGCDSSGAILVFDEIVTSRMGFGGVQALAGVVPDMTTFGKYIGAGFSAGAFGGRADIMALMDPTRPGSLPHAGTFNNNLFSMTAGAEALEHAFDRDEAEALFERGERLRARINDILRSAELPAQATGLGSIMNIHFTTRTIRQPADTVGADKRFFDLLHLDLMEQGVYIARRGQINLSLPMSDGQIAQISDAVARFAADRKALFDQGLATSAKDSR